MNFNNNNNTQKNQSLKCNYPPGGNTNFSIGWGQGPEPVNSLKQTGKNYGSNINYTSNGYFDKENINKSNVIAGISTQTKSAGYGKGKIDIFNGTDYSEKSSSIKVNHMPGGKSNVYLGNDSSNYEEYRRK
jgi:hypothetical protein